jgi:hypothetical protein
MTTNTIKDLAQQASLWPDEDQQELVDYARVIEARRTGLYRMTDAERAAVAEGIAEANKGEFVENHVVSAAERSRRS